MHFNLNSKILIDFSNTAHFIIFTVLIRAFQNRIHFYKKPLFSNPFLYNKDQSLDSKLVFFDLFRQLPLENMDYKSERNFQMIYFIIVKSIGKSDRRYIDNLSFEHFKEHILRRNQKLMKNIFLWLIFPRYFQDNLFFKLSMNSMRV